MVNKSVAIFMKMTPFGVSLRNYTWYSYHLYDIDASKAEALEPLLKVMTQQFLNYCKCD